MRKRNVPVANVVKEVDLVSIEKKTGGDGMHRCVTPTLVEESSIFIKSSEEVHVGVRSQPIEITDLEIRPLRCISQACLDMGATSRA